MSYEAFRWRGEPIHNIEQWARDRDEHMVHYRMTVQTPWGPEVTDGRMPESFYDHLGWKGDTSYEELGRYKP